MDMQLRKCLSMLNTGHQVTSCSTVIVFNRPPLSCVSPSVVGSVYQLCALNYTPFDSTIGHSGPIHPIPFSLSQSQ